VVAVPLRYDPFDASILNDPYPTYRVLRDAAPVYRAQDSHTWVLSRHADVQAAALDHGTYSSVDGIFPTPPGSDFIGSFLPMMIVMDPPRHDQLRALVSRAFTPRRVAGLQTTITRMAAELFERLDEGSGSADFVTDFAAILPAAVIADLLGVPATDRDQFRSWSSQLVQVDVTHGHTSDALAAAASIYAYFTDFLADRRHNPREDLMSALANATVDGVGLTDEEVLGFCALLLVAGYETTTNLLGNAAVVRYPLLPGCGAGADGGSDRPECVAGQGAPVRRLRRSVPSRAGRPQSHGQPEVDAGGVVPVGWHWSSAPARPRWRCRRSPRSDRRLTRLQNRALRERGAER
jgi:cytochrome P450